MTAVGDAAFEMINEIRRQFKEIPGLMEGTAEPDSEKCVEIATTAALKKMMLPGVIAVSMPAVVGFGLGAQALGGMLAGGLLGCVSLALMMANAGGAWDNAKKSFEAGVEINGEMTYKGSEAHKAAVTGDTVGDPFKDTSGPSMNILIKLTCLIGLVIAPILGGGHVSDEVSAVNKSEIKKCSSEGKKACCAKTENKDLVVNADEKHVSIINSSENVSITIDNYGETVKVKEINISAQDLNVNSTEESEKSSL